MCTRCCGGYAVLAGAGLSDDSLLTHAHGQERLAHGVVDLVCAGMRKVFPLQHNARATRMGSEAGRFRQRRGAPHKVA